MAKKSKSRRISSVTNVSGGVSVDAERDVNIDGDVVGRDKIVSIVGDNVAGDRIATIDQRWQQVGSQINVAGDYITAAVPSLSALRQLPPPPIDFTGHAAELAELLSNIEHGAIITGLRGMGGIGKTALALVLADKLKGKYPDAQFYLDLRGASDKPMSSIEAMQHVILGYHPMFKLPDDPNGISALYRSVLDGQRALLLMDNAKDEEQIRPLLPPASCLLLITSRQKFSVQGMRDPIDLNTLLPDDARTLVLTIAKRIGDFADEIAKLCGYLPLALQVSASTLAERADLRPQDFIHRLGDTQQRLQLTGVDASLQSSYDLLMPELKQTFCQLAVFPASFDAAAEETVCQDKYHLRLSELVRLSLAQYNETNRRYHLHDLVRLFSDAQINDNERNAAQHRHAAHYEFVNRSARKLFEQGGEGITNGLAWFDQELVNIKVGQEWSAKHFAEDNQAAKICNAYLDWPYLLDLRLHPREMIHWLSDALNAARRLKDRMMEGAHLGNLGGAYSILGETRMAIEFFQQQLKIAREIGDRRSEGNALGNLGNTYFSLSETRNAIRYHRRSLTVKRRINDKRGEGNTLTNLGNTYFALGEVRKAIEYHEQALKICHEIGNRHGEGLILGSLGTAYAALGETRQAIEFYEQDLGIAHQLGDRRGESIALWNLSLEQDKVGEREKAINNAEAALKIKEEIDDPWAETVRKQLVEWKG